MKYFYITLLILSFNDIQASIYSNLKKNVLSLLQRTNDEKALESNIEEIKRSPVRYFQQNNHGDSRDTRSAHNKANILKKARKYEDNLNIGRDMPSSKLTESLNKKIEKERYHMDPVLNELKRRSFRRADSASADAERDSGSSSSLEMKFWMDDWDEHWMQKKFEALNSTEPRGDVVNMVAARPWGVPCGDPNQHDMPWGSCMLAMECDAEYRIYRGDYFCGRTQYVCCALLLTNYDMYQGLDLSFEGSSFSTDSNEKNFQADSKEAAHRARKQERTKRKQDRAKRKRDIRRSIRRIIQEIRKILNRAWRNGTAQRKKKTKELKKFIAMMKKQYREDRKAVVNVHEHELLTIDEELQQKLNEITDVNQEFMSNNTFRDIIVNGTVNKEKLMKLLRAHPELAKLFIKRRTDVQVPEVQEEPVYLEYDLEYGQLYF